NPQQRRQILEAALLEWLATSFQRPISEFSTQDPLTAYLDSLMVFTLRAHLEQHLQIQIPIKQFLNSSSLTQLVEFALNQLLFVDLVETGVVSSDKLDGENAISREKLRF
ncbi:MAG TPA: acyl carrier protein, partial [Elainellaceae cyanobacterium]